MNRPSPDRWSLPAGWLATTLGGMLGVGGGGFAGLTASIAYVDTYQDSGLEGITTIVVGGLIGAFIGAAAGAAALLRLRRHSRALASGIAFSVFGTILLLLVAILGSMVVPEELHEVLGAIALGLVVPALTGIVTRALI